MSGYEPRWDHAPDFNGRDRPYGEEGQQVVSDVIAALREGRAIEDKRKRNPDNRFYIELSQDPGRRGEYKASGLFTTQADLYAWVIADTGSVLFTPTDRLWAGAVALGLGRPKAETDGDNPTRGRVLSWSEIMCEDVTRWVALNPRRGR